MKKLLLAGLLCAGLSISHSVQAATYTVTTTSDSNNGDCTASLCSLRDAVIKANYNNSDDTIVLGTGTYTLSVGNGSRYATEDVSATGDLDINDSSGANHSVTIVGNGSSNTIINSGINDRVLDIFTDATIDSLTISGGTLQSNTASSKGGGVHIGGSSTVTMTRCIVTNNSANSVSGNTYGGGVSVDGYAIAKISNCTISNNTLNASKTSYGAGVDVSDYSSLTLNKSTVSGNSIVNGNSSVDNYGGGIRGGSSSTIIVKNTTISGNDTGKGYGGGIAIYGYAYQNTYLSFVTISNNTATRAGGLYTEADNSNIKNSIVSENTATDSGNNCYPGNGATYFSSGDYNVEYLTTPDDGCSFGGNHDTQENPNLSALSSNSWPNYTHAINNSSSAKDLIPSASCTDHNGDTITTDERGLIRPAGNKCDAGAYELDLTAPTISITNGTPTTVECKATYTDAGATATDNFDGSVTVLSDGVGSVNTSTPGTYSVTYSATDSSGNQASTDRKVNVVDTTKPTITVLGTSPIKVPVGSTYADGGASASDGCDLSVSVTSTNDINMAVPGRYTVSYSAMDDSGNIGTASREVRVIGTDTVFPSITLIGNSTVSYEAGTYVDLGATASDNVDGDITRYIEVLGGDFTSTIPGTYIVTYSVTDTSDNTTLVTRTVTITPDVTAPVITLLGDNPYEVSKDAQYTDPGATAKDAVDGDVTSNLRTDDSGLLMGTAGTYSVIYTARDVAGNEATTTRTVTVVYHGVLSSAVGIANGAVDFTWEDGSTRTVTIFANDTQIPLTKITSDNIYVVVLSRNGKNLALINTISGATVRLKVNKKKQIQAILAVKDFYKDGKDEVVIASRRKKKDTLILVPITSEHIFGKKVSLKTTGANQAIKLKVKLAKHKLLIKQKKTTLLTAKVQKTYKLKKVKAA